MKKHIALITNAEKNSGVGSRAYQLLRHMGELSDIQITPVVLDGKENTLAVDGKITTHISRLPSVLGSKSVSWIRLAHHLPRFDMYDISNQTLSFIAKKRRPNIVTVHDIIELTNPQDQSAYMLNKYLMSGIVHAQTIIAVSQYTKKSIHEYFGVPNSLITVIPNGVDEAYHSIANFRSSIAYQELLQDFRIAGNTPIILSVGSEHPRKNIKTVLRTIALLKKQFPNIMLIKVGDAGILAGRKETLDTIDAFDLKANVQLLGNVPTERLNELYNIADALLFPSHHEGFGMPPLEAMAAHCPVLCSNATSLPEVVGDGAIMHSADDTEAFAKSIVHIISNTEFRNTLISKGKKRAGKFSWGKSAHDMLQLYRTFL